MTQLVYIPSLPIFVSQPTVTSTFCRRALLIVCRVSSDRYFDPPGAIANPKHGIVHAALCRWECPSATTIVWQVRVLDDDTQGVYASKSQLVVSEDGLTDSYTLRLSSQPTGIVIIVLSSDPPNQLMVDPRMAFGVSVSVRQYCADVSVVLPRIKTLQLLLCVHLT